MKESHFTKKYSVQFVTTDGKISAPFYFFQHLDHDAAKTWQVRRSEFDQMLAEHAQQRGAEYRFGLQAREILRENDQVVGIEFQDGEGTKVEIKAPLTLDCTGRMAFAMNKNGWRVKDPCLNKMAVWTYYQGAKRDEGLDEGATTVAYVPEKGWFWYIPLHDDIVSVGIVAEPNYLYRDGRDPQKMFEREIGNNPWIAEHLAPGTPTGEFHATGDYSYRSKYCAEDGLVLVGDAFAFLDPVFSSGVFLALKSGDMVADAAAAALAAGDVSAARFAEYGERLCNMIEPMRKLVYSFYDEDFSFGQVLKKYPEIRGDITDCLIGHLEKDYTVMFDRISEFADIPDPLPHGRALLPVT
jgi:flavin-dependent dehydrogenase